MLEQPVLHIFVDSKLPRLLGGLGEKIHKAIKNNKHLILS